MKNEFKGTKGEWVYSPFQEDSNGYITVEIPMGSITVYDGYYPLDLENNRKEVIEVQQANAKLIACAPEMLELLIRLSDFEPLSGSKEIEQLIKKATEL